MKRHIYIKSQTMRNFKGIRNLEIPFTHVTNIYGQNATGKTSVFDAFKWLLFGKDSSDRKDFSIKTLDKNNNPIHKLSHEVEDVLNVDGVDISLKRVFKEKWVKKRGEEEPEFSGHETEFFYNDVPLQLAEYQEKINNILKESIFKLITDATYFNTGLKWQDRRNMLMELAGPIADSLVIDSLKGGKNDGGFDSLLLVLNSGKSLKEYRDEIRNKKSLIKKEIILMPARIDEVKRGMPDVIDEKSIQKLIDQKQKEIDEVENAISDKTDAYQKAYKAIQEKQTTLHQHKSRRQEIGFAIRQNNSDALSAIRQSRNAFTNRIETLEQDLKSKENLLISTKNKKDGFTHQLDVLRTQWTSINAQQLVFDENDFQCPACKREFEQGDVASKKDELQRNFNENKNRLLAANRQAGIGSKADVEHSDTMILTLEKAIETIKTEIADQRGGLEAFEKANKVEAPSLDEQLAGNDEYVQLGAKIARLESEVAEAPVFSDFELKQKRNTLAAERDGHKANLNDKPAREKAVKRIAELEAEEKTMAQEIAKLEQTEFLAEGFTKAKNAIMGDRINDRFSYVKFKMFEVQINGGEAECCETLINGVPYSDANNAARINAGIDIINVLCEHYQVWAPIFVDNRESVTELIETKSQVINLVVKEDAELSVNKVKFIEGSPSWIKEQMTLAVA